MAITYVYHLIVNMDQLHSGIKNVFDTVNKIMKNSGDNGKLVWRGQGLDFKVTTERTLTDKELTLLSDTILDNFNQRLPNWNVEIESIEIRISE